MERSLGLKVVAGVGEPIYQQIFDQIVRRIRAGAFPPGYRLPPSRALAAELGTHRNTVVRAYAELDAAGFLTSTVGRGTFVADQASAPSEGTDAIDAVLPWGSLLSESANAEPLMRLDRLRRGVRRTGRGGGDLIDLARMQPAEELLPHELFGRCVSHVLRTVGPRALGYAPRDGVPRLRELIAEDLGRQGVPASADDVVITTGSQQALDLITRALLNAGDRLLVQDATYSGAIQLFATNGARLVGIPEDENGPSLDVLSRVGRGAAAFYLMPNHNNPTGACISATRRRDLVEWSRAAGVPLVEDDYAADLDLVSDPPPPALRALSADVIYVATFSKKLIPALRVGFLVCPPRLRPHLTALKHAMDLGSSALMQYALAEFIERGYLRPHLRRAREAYRKRHAALGEELERVLPGDVRWQPARRGVTLWLELPEGLHSEEVFEEARRRGVIVAPGTLNRVGSGGQQGVRLTFCWEPVDRLQEGARRLGAALAAVRNGNQRNGSERPHLGIV